MRVLVACEFSGRVRDAFAARGHYAVSCDLIDTERPAGRHWKGDVLSLLSGSAWDLMIAHPPCTYLTNAGVQHLHSIKSCKGKVTAVHGAARFVAMREASMFFKALLDASVDRIAVENPIPHRYALQEIGVKYDQIIQPWQFGHAAKKATCLWLKGLPKLIPTAEIPRLLRHHIKADIHRVPPGPTRQADRSRTYSGIAAAMAEQWG